jgi:TatD DNase family protein
MVLETDAPYMSPVRGRRNEPANVRVGAEKVAEIKGVSVSEVEDVTTENALSFLGVRDG